MKTRRFVSLSVVVVRHPDRDEEEQLSPDLVFTAIADDGSAWAGWLDSEDRFEDLSWSPLPAVPDAPPMLAPPRPPSKETPLHGGEIDPMLRPSARDWTTDP